jgi:hypothetical protein
MPVTRVMDQLNPPVSKLPAITVGSLAGLPLYEKELDSAGREAIERLLWYCQQVDKWSYVEIAKLCDQAVKEKEEFAKELLAYRQTCRELRETRDHNHWLARQQWHLRCLLTLGLYRFWHPKAPSQPELNLPPMPHAPIEHSLFRPHCGNDPQPHGPIAQITKAFHTLADSNLVQFSFEHTAICPTQTLVDRIQAHLCTGLFTERADFVPQH